MAKKTQAVVVSLLLLLSFSMTTAQEIDDMSNGMSNEESGVLTISQTGTDNFPEVFDWRDKDGKNWMTPVKNQGLCGCCWVFSVIGVVEAATRIYANDPNLFIDLSEQHLVSKCCWTGDCDGGYPHWALEYIAETGVPDENCSPYTENNSACTPCSGWEEDAVKIDYTSVSSSKEDLKDALQRYGPLVVTMNTNDWFFPGREISESTGTEAANLAVVLVGWNDSGDYWIVKNSWGLGWGEDGYGKIPYGDIERHNYAYAVTGIVDNNPNLPPTAKPSASPESGIAPLEVAFIGNGEDIDGTIVSYEWTLGDGISSTSQNPIHVYTAPDIYTATLTVTDDDGATGSADMTITVTEPEPAPEPIVWSWVSPVAAKASSSKWNRGPEKAIDGKGTYWSSSRFDISPRWIQFDLGEEQQIDKVRVMVKSPVTLDIRVSNDTVNWTTVAPDIAIDKRNVFVEISFTGTDARYVKIQENFSPVRYVQCREFEVHVAGGTTTT